jgi:hypothetical protein
MVALGGNTEVSQHEPSGAAQSEITHLQLVSPARRSLRPLITCMGDMPHVYSERKSDSEPQDITK